jgi:hypothetical protein
VGADDVEALRLDPADVGRILLLGELLREVVRDTGIGGHEPSIDRFGQMVIPIAGIMKGALGSGSRIDHKNITYITH